MSISQRLLAEAKPLLRGVGRQVNHFSNRSNALLDAPLAERFLELNKLWDVAQPELRAVPKLDDFLKFHGNVPDRYIGALRETTEGLLSDYPEVARRMPAGINVYNAPEVMPFSRELGPAFSMSRNFPSEARRVLGEQYQGGVFMSLPDLARTIKSNPASYIGSMALKTGTGLERMQGVLTHEFGHQVHFDFMRAFSAQFNEHKIPDFINMRGIRGQLNSPYAKVNAKEFMAEVFTENRLYGKSPLGQDIMGIIDQGVSSTKATSQEVRAAGLSGPNPATKRKAQKESEILASLAFGNTHSLTMSRRR